MKVPSKKATCELAQWLHATYRADNPQAELWAKLSKPAQHRYKLIAMALLYNPPVVLRLAVRRLEGW